MAPSISWPASTYQDDYPKPMRRPEVAEQVRVDTERSRSHPRPLTGAIDVAAGSILIGAGIGAFLFMPRVGDVLRDIANMERTGRPGFLTFVVAGLAIAGGLAAAYQGIKEIRGTA